MKRPLVEEARAVASTNTANNIGKARSKSPIIPERETPVDKAQTARR